MSHCLTWNPCRIGKPITATHVSKSIKKSLYLTGIHNTYGNNVSPSFAQSWQISILTPKHIVISCSDELAGLLHIAGKV